MGIWQLGNTSVRSVMRIKDGLTALSTSTIQGNIRKGQGDIAFRRLLGECGVVSLGKDATNSVGRKWRSAMGKLGFLYPEVKKSAKREGTIEVGGFVYTGIESAMAFSQDDLGPLDRITPAGWDLIRAETVAAMQECYLRAMVTPLVPLEEGRNFSPLCWTLAILLELERRGQEPSVNFIEMACFVQTTTPFDGLLQTVDRILAFRSRRNAAERKRQFDQTFYASVAAEFSREAQTFRDYADMNIRYLKAAGVVQSKGKGIGLIPEKHTLALALSKQLISEQPLLELYRSLCKGTKLPTDQAAVAYQVLEDLLHQSQAYGIAYSLEEKPLHTPAQINQIRYEIETLITEKKEEQYAKEQRNQWREIAAYMDLLASRKERIRVDSQVELRVPRTEAPAYLEWSLWRAFLAIGTLVNKPYKVRRFKIDQDFLPVSTAPGNGPDLIAEFEDCVVAIEVTLAESSRQEAMEGEPVRRHVADLMLQYQKPVYGLFIANRIDSNTAETFRIGVWYTKEDNRLHLHIVPLTLAQFSAFFQAIFSNGTATYQAMISLLNECESHRKRCEAPEWKQVIAEIVQKNIQMLPAKAENHHGG